MALEAQLGRALDGTRLAQCETVAEVELLVGARAIEASGQAIEKKEEEPIVLPPIVADTAKRIMSRFQMGFYDKVMEPKVSGRAFIPTTATPSSRPTTRATSTWGS